MDKYYKCKNCGTVIDLETGEHHFAEGSNVHKFKTLEKKCETLQSDLKRALEANDRLLEGIKSNGEENGNIGSGSGETIDKEDRVSGDKGDTGQGQGIWED